MNNFIPLVLESLFPLDRVLQVVLECLEHPKDQVVDNKCRQCKIMLFTTTEYSEQIFW